MHTIALRTNSNTTNSDSVSETSTNSDCTASTTCSNSNSVPAFLTKLWNLVEDPKYDDLICWSQGGTSFIIRNQDQFARKLLPKYYKHKNLASFIRQLNMYGFRKTSNLEHSGLKNESDEVEFYHQYFLRGQGVFLECIKRKVRYCLLNM
ncbi:heat shock factor protein-like [Limulus polyphemus]|uniref:Heat shock factor protein-like n=1 Tax=Limulus polyphemus TaxID=6850 RepID=A0ABM1TED3_LIMPO|nr:heat shock factor protein-like [Limulus polyphemus]